MLGGLGIGELIVVFLIILLFFGARRLPEIGGSLGKGIREFKGSLREVTDDARGELHGSNRETRGGDNVDAGTGVPESTEQGR